MDQLVYDSSILNPTWQHVQASVPPEFLWAYEWFSDPQNKFLTHLPMGKSAPDGAPLKLASQSGIHSPNYNELESRGANKRKYALMVHSSGSGYYDDDDVINLGDGTWLYGYRAHEKRYGDRGKKEFNAHLLQNMEDCIPVAVLVKRGRTYSNLGLAFVDSYNAETGTFYLHGPVSIDGLASGSYAMQLDPATEEESALLSNYFDPEIIRTEDNKQIVTARQVRRLGQTKFRESLMNAYEGQCAVSGVTVPHVLEASHIFPYRGKNSQHVKNGLLLRADLHKLFDAHRLAVDPDGFKIWTSKDLSRSSYSEFYGRTVKLPSAVELRPSTDLLGAHLKECLSLEAA